MICNFCNFTEMDNYVMNDQFFYCFIISERVLKCLDVNFELSDETIVSN